MLVAVSTRPQHAVVSGDSERAAALGTNGTRAQRDDLARELRMLLHALHPDAVA